MQPRRVTTQRTREGRPRASLAWALAMLAMLGMLVVNGIAHADARGQIIDVNPDADGFQLWYTIGSEGFAMSSDLIQIGGSAGQALAGVPNPLATDTWVTSGFWAPGVDYDTTDVDPGDSTDVVIATLAVGDDIAGQSSIASFALMPVQPNPCHGVAYIGWTAPRSAHVKLAVFDVQGREAATLANGEYAAGRYVAKWNAAGAMPTSGIYFVRLETPEGMFMRRVTIVR